MMLPQFCRVVLIFIGGAGMASAATINMDSGVGGSYMPGQSYNETRAVDVTVLSPFDLNVSSMTLSGIGGSGLAKAVIYDSTTHSLIASAQGPLTGGTITLSLSATLVSGEDYRIGFFGNLGNGTFFLPGGVLAFPGGFPYTESSGLLQINSAWSIATDSFPANPNLLVPQISMQVSVAVPEPQTLALVGLGLFPLMRFTKGRRGR